MPWHLVRLDSLIVALCDSCSSHGLKVRGGAWSRGDCGDRWVGVSDHCVEQGSAVSYPTLPVG